MTLFGMSSSIQHFHRFCCRIFFFFFFFLASIPPPRVAHFLFFPIVPPLRVNCWCYTRQCSSAEYIQIHLLYYLWREKIQHRHFYLYVMLLQGILLLYTFINLRECRPLHFWCRVKTTSSSPNWILQNELRLNVWLIRFSTKI